jgi:hypothetical protein
MSDISQVCSGRTMLIRNLLDGLKSAEDGANDAQAASV